MGAIFGRVKTWTSTEDVTAADLNAEFDNILNNLVPLQVDDYSVNVAQMQIKTDPGEVGSESLATTDAGELERLRFAIGEIKGTTQWYESGVSSILELAGALGGGLPANRISSGKSTSNSSQSLFLKPDGTARTITLEGAATNFIYAVEGISFTISTDVTITSLIAAPSTNNTALVNNADIADGDETKVLGEYGTSITIDTVGSAITSLVGELAGFKINNGSTDEFFIAEVESSTKLSKIRRGYFFNSSSVAIPRVAIANNDTITLMKLTWIYATITGTLTAGFTTPKVQADEPGSPSVGDFWFDTVNDKWKTFTSSFVDADLTLIGICLQDDTSTVAARGFDFFKNIDDLNTFHLAANTASTVKAMVRGAQLNVFGSTIRFDPDFVTWDMGSDLDSGVSEAADKTFYFYMTETGDTIISDVVPSDFRETRRGLYHPSETWLCLGQANNDASQDLEAVIDYQEESENRYVITNAVATSALTVKLHADPTNKFYLRDTTITSGETSFRNVPATISLTVPSTATMGHASAIDDFLHAYIIDSTDQPLLALSTEKQNQDLLRTSIAITTGADDDDLYSLSAQTNQPVSFLGVLLSQQSTAGTWAAVATRTSMAFTNPDLFELAELLLTGGNGHGSTNTRIRRFTTERINRGTAMTYVDSVTLGGAITINDPGVYSIHYSDRDNAGSNVEFGVSLNTTQLGTDIVGITDLDIVCVQSTSEILFGDTVSATRYLRAGDVLRAHTDGAPDGTVSSQVRLIVKKVN